MRISFHIALFIFFSQTITLPQSPYSLDTGREIAIFGSGVLLGIVDIKLIENKDPINYEELSHLSRENVNSFDRGATYNWSPSAAEWSNVLLITTIASPLLMFTSSSVRADAGIFLTMYLQNILTTYSVSHFPKGIINRYRPYVYNEDVPDEIKQNVDATHSFLSAHTSVAFASAVFLSITFAKYNPDSNLTPYIWGTSLLFASAVGYLRYASGNHFPTDIIAGAIVGSVVGFLIPLIHESNEEEKGTVVHAGNPYNNLISFSTTF
ncbi:MAG: phosphoesterase PA-phosphatase [Ignavibacteriae bacterium]|nr:MAG: phosphoesterase PA-phosphatase [Ignavibacteriota bacterium]